MPAPEMYGAFASVYDRLMAEVDYDAWASHYRALLDTVGVQDGAAVLEAACGTGNLTLRLARHYEVLPSDASPEMLSVAAGKARAAGLSLTFLRQDMRQLRAHRPVDAVVCACDGVNYLLSEAALKAFLDAAYRALRPGGALAFDVSSRDKLSRVLAGQPQVFRSERLCYLWENAWDSAKSRLSLSLSVFDRQKDGAYRRIDEEQVQRGWTEAELRAALIKAGFAGIRFFGNFSLKKPAGNAQRLHVCALRPADEGNNTP